MPALIKTQNHHKALYCPVCGHPIDADSADGALCSHVAYIYDDTLSTFIRVAPTIQTLVQSITQEDEANEQIIQQLMDAPEGADMMMVEYRPLDHPVIRLEHKLKQDSMLHMAIHSPTEIGANRIIRFGIDFNVA